MAYYVGYQNGYLKPKDVDYGSMTHIVVGGVGVRPDGTLNEHFHLTNGDGRAMAEDVQRRAAKAGVRTLIWLGGPNEEDAFLAATSDKNRERFVDSILTLVDELGYDGVDIDWEPIRAKDEPGLLALVRDLRAARPDLLITVPINWVTSTLVGKKDLSFYEQLARESDRLFIMSYSMAGPWAGWQSWHGSAQGGAGSKTPSSVESSVDAYLAAGVPREKLGIGIGTYASCWPYPVRGPKQSVSSGKVSVMSMRTLMEDYYTKKYEKWDSRAEVPYLSFPKARGDQKCGFISYENERSVGIKMQYVQEEKLGGALVWNIGTGYFPKASSSKRHPLLRAVYANR
jgi:chitinase